MYKSIGDHLFCFIIQDQFRMNTQTLKVWISKVKGKYSNWVLHYENFDNMKNIDRVCQIYRRYRRISDNHLKSCSRILEPRWFLWWSIWPASPFLRFIFHDWPIWRSRWPIWPIRLINRCLGYSQHWTCCVQDNPFDCKSRHTWSLESIEPDCSVITVTIWEPHLYICIG